jgi:predicted nucleic acid-binding protein
LVAFLVDSNVLVYAYEAGESPKARRARDCIRSLGEARNGALSVQVLGEFFVAVTRRVRPPLSAIAAERIATNFSRSWPVLPLTGTTALEAMRAVERYQFQYWDGLIWATAKLYGIPNVLTEDLPSASLVESVRFQNPFDAGFDLARLD